MKRTVTYPDWVEKYRTKGRTIRKVRNGYGLYECTSKYVKGKKYPVSVQKYLGMITKDKGFIPKVTSESHPKKRTYIEYGLSHFLMTNFKRKLVRSLNGGSEEMVILGIVFYMFGGISEVFIRSTYLTHGIEDKLIGRVNGGVAIHRLNNVKNKIDKLLIEAVPDDEDRNSLVKLLFLSVIDRESVPENYELSDEIKAIIERYGLKI